MTEQPDHLEVALTDLKPSLEALLMVADEPLDAVSLASAVGRKALLREVARGDEGEHVT